MIETAHPNIARAMTPLTRTRPLTIALVGNPNTGKSTLFNVLCGLRQRVGNYPGVTVERKLGQAQFPGQKFHVLDLPGSYSLAPRSPDEMVAVDVLLGRRQDTERPDAIVCILDASNLERNLYLVSQVLELGLPTVIALNMVDVAREKGMEIDDAELGRRLQIPVVPIQAHRSLGVDALKAALLEIIERVPSVPPSPFPPAFCQEVDALQAVQTAQGGERLPRYLLERLLLDTSGYLASAHLAGVDDRVLEAVGAARQRLAAAGMPVPAVEAASRYQWVGQMTQDVVSRSEVRRLGWTDRIDRVLTHKLGGTVIFVLAMLLMFQVVFSVAEPASRAIEWLNGVASGLVAAWMPEGMLRSLLTDGVIEGVGGVLVFLPQILVLFLFIAILEDCGYMARAAYLMDKLMTRLGLSGKSFIPLLSSFACAIPGIMSARVIENRRDRLITILIAPLMSCSARLPVYTLLIGAFIPNRRWLGGFLGLQGLTLLAMYALGIVAAMLVAWTLRKTILRGETPPFIMELPAYKMPGPRVVLFRMVERGWDFVQRAGTLILAVTVLVWAAAYFPHSESQLHSQLAAEQQALSAELDRLRALPELAAPAETARVADALARIEARIDGEQLRQSYLGRVGRLVEPLVRPLGWDWRIGCAVIASFPAREVVIATLGVIYNVGSEPDEQSEGLRETLREATWPGTSRPVFTIPVALSLMVFFALCAQCASTLVIMWRETGSWGWPALTFVYMTTLAYFGALATFQLGSRLLS